MPHIKRTIALAAVVTLAVSVLFCCCRSGHPLATPVMKQAIMAKADGSCCHKVPQHDSKPCTCKTTLKMVADVSAAANDTFSHQGAVGAMAMEETSTLHTISFQLALHDQNPSGLDPGVPLYIKLSVFRI